MTDLIDQPTFWLNLTNIGLGVFCAILFLHVAGAALKDGLSRRRPRGR